MSTGQAIGARSVAPGSYRLVIVATEPEENRSAARRVGVRVAPLRQPAPEPMWYP